jgi:hypothetical protein
MDFQEIIQALSCTVFVEGADFGTAQVRSVVASDLMSDVLTTNEEDFIISTSLNSEQVIRTADIVGASGVLLVNGKHPQESMKNLAADHGITVLSTREACFSACCILGTLLKKKKEERGSP